MLSRSVTLCRRQPSFRALARRESVCGAFVVLISGCSELQARRYARSGNAYFRERQYTEAIREYERAGELSPGLPEVALNRGLACRELMDNSAARSADHERAVDCALAAFSRLKELSPEDPRGDQLYIQTLFDAPRFDTLVAIYEARIVAK